MAVSLVALATPLQGQTLPLTDGSLTVGREPSNDLHPNDLSLSRRHCTLVVARQRVTVMDLESLNGTFVNGAPVKERTLEHGDQLKIGESVFVFVDQEVAFPDQSVVEPADTAPRMTVALRQEDVLFLQAGQNVSTIAPTPRATRELLVLFHFSAEPRGQAARS